MASRGAGFVYHDAEGFLSLRPADIYGEIARMHREGIAGVVATVTDAGGSTPRGAGARMIVYADGRTLGSVGGGAVEARTIERALELVGSSEPELMKFDLDEDTEMACGGRMEVFLEPVAPGPAALIVGGGHVGQAVAAAAKLAGFRVTVVDDRADVVSEERFPTADVRMVGGTELLDAGLEVRSDTFVVVVTRGHKYDAEWVLALSNDPPRYLGMIGSEKKVRGTFERLEAEGVTSDVLDSVYAPIGIDIGAETPAEIAVSVVAEMIAVGHGITDTAMLRTKPGAKNRNR